MLSFQPPAQQVSNRIHQGLLRLALAGFLVGAEFTRSSHLSADPDSAHVRNAHQPIVGFSPAKSFLWLAAPITGDAQLTK